MWAYLARRFNEHFGNGSASYVDIRDRFGGDELEAWLVFFDTFDDVEKARKAQAEHDKVMTAAATAAARG